MLSFATRNPSLSFASIQPIDSKFANPVGDGFLLLSLSLVNGAGR